MSAGGRPPGLEPTPEQVRYLRRLIRSHDRAKESLRESLEELEDYARELVDGGCSGPSIGRAVGVPPDTVKSWIRQSRRRTE